MEQFEKLFLDSINEDMGNTDYDDILNSNSVRTLIENLIFQINFCV